MGVVGRAFVLPRRRAHNAGTPGRATATFAGPDTWVADPVHRRGDRRRVPVHRWRILIRISDPDPEGDFAPKSGVPPGGVRGSSPNCRYLRCINPGSTGLCWSVRTVAVFPGVIPAGSLFIGSFRNNPTHPDTPNFQIWEQEAGSSNLPIPTTSTRGDTSNWSSVIWMCGCVIDQQVAHLQHVEEPLPVASHNSTASSNTRCANRDRRPASVTTSTLCPRSSWRSMRRPPRSKSPRSSSRSTRKSMSLVSVASPQATDPKTRTREASRAGRSRGSRCDEFSGPPASERSRRAGWIRRSVFTRGSRADGS